MPVAAALLVFASLSTFTSLLLSLHAGVLTSGNSWISLLIGTAAGVYAFYRSRGLSAERGKTGFFVKLMFGFFALFCLRQFLWVYYIKSGDIVTLNRYPYADLHFHLAFINNFVNGAAFWPENPLFHGAKLSYHFGADLFTALLVKAGAALTGAMPWVGLIAGLILMFALYWWGGGFAMAAFLFAGGTAGYMVLVTGVFEDYQANLAWKSLALTLLLPQRGYLFGFPAGLLLLWSWRRRFLQGKPGLPVFVEACLWGLMPLFQINTFVFVSFIFLVWTVAARKVREALPVYYLAVPPATFLFLHLTDFFNKVSFMVWIKPGWMIDDANPFVFFIVNFGFYLPFAVWVLYAAIRKKDRVTLLEVCPAISLFLVLMFVMFGPWEWDNVKFMVWCYLLVLPGIDKYVVQKLRPLSRAVVLTALFLSGFVCIVSAMNRSNQGIKLMELKELDGVCHAIRDIPNEEHFASTQAAYHPVLFCGHRLAVGYNGVLSAAFGLDAPPAEDHLYWLMMGEHTWRKRAEYLDTRYVFWGPREEKRYEGSNRVWEAEALRIADEDWGQIYDLHQPAPWAKAPEQIDTGPDQGLRALYFDNKEWKGNPVKEERVPFIHFDWSSHDRPFATPFGIVFEGEVFVPESGEVTFYLASDDGSSLRIAGEELIDNSGVHALRVRTAKKQFERGWHELKVHYMDIGGGAIGRLWWRLPSGVEEVISAASFRTGVNAE